MLKYGLVLFILLLGFVLEAQNQERIKGLWVGKLTQFEGGYLELYDFEIYFNQTDSVIAGYTYLKSKGVLGIIEFVGCYRGNVLHLEEKKIVFSEKPEELSWCFKKMQLKFVVKKKRRILEGTWKANSQHGRCIPGEVSIVKVKPRA